MLRIKLSQTGKKHQLSHRIVVAEKRSKRDGQHREIIGYYDPKTKPVTLKIKKDRLAYWLKQGAQLTEGVRKILKDEITA